MFDRQMALELKVKTWPYTLRLYVNDVQVSARSDVNTRVPLVLTIVYSKDCRRQSSMSLKVRKVHQAVQSLPIS